MLIQEPVKEYALPVLERNPLEDAFDEIELLSFPVSCSPFDLLKTNFRRGVRAKDLSIYHKQTIKILAYLMSRKHVPTKKGDMYFGTWIDIDGDYLILRTSGLFKRIPFSGRWYLLHYGYC